MLAASAALLALVIAVAGCGGSASGGGATSGGGDSSSGQAPVAASPEVGHVPTVCNGSEAACDEPLNHVVFPGTHNSYAASAEPGWHFAGQHYGIPRQLDGGIRALLLDVHYGVEASSGVVRTDFAAEGADANKLAEAVPAPALRAAERIAGPLGVALPQAKPRLYLCHTLCELGAEPLERELKAIHSFLIAHPNTFLMLVMEDYVPAARIAAAFEDAGLAKLAVTLPRHGAQPAMAELFLKDKRLAVFSEKGGGDPSWYMPAFAYIQDTPLGANRPDQLSCARFRSAPDGPYLLINHWIPPFPPSVRLNALIGRRTFLRRRIDRCTKARGTEGAIVAVDFYDRTSVVRVAEEVNAR